MNVSRWHNNFSWTKYITSYNIFVQVTTLRTTVQRVDPLAADGSLCSLNGTMYRHSFNEIRDLHTPYSTVSFQMTFSDLEWFSKIFNDMNRRAVSLRQLVLHGYDIYEFMMLHTCAHIHSMSSHITSFCLLVFFQPLANMENNNIRLLLSDDVMIA